MHSAKRVCLIHAYPTPYIVESLASAGFNVVVVGNVASVVELDAVEAALDVPMSDHEALCEAVINYHRQQPIDALLPINEGTVSLTAELIDRLRLPGMAPTTALASRNKFLSSLVWQNYAVPVPRTFAVYDSDSAKQLASKELAGKGIIKLVDSMNSQGVMAFHSAQQCGSAADTLLEMTEQVADGTAKPGTNAYDRNSFAYGKSDLKLILQEFCQGKEVSVEVLLDPDAGDRALAVLEKAPLLGPCFAETASFYPCTLNAEQEQEVRQLAIRAAKTLGLKAGPAHVEIRYDGDQAKVLEAGLRPGGGYTVQLIERLLGENIFVSQASLACGLPYARGTAAENEAILFGGIVYHQSGTLANIEGIEIFENNPLVEKIVFLNERGDKVTAMPRSAQPHFCYYLLSGTNNEQLIACHQSITEAVTLTIDPVHC